MPYELEVRSSAILYDGEKIANLCVHEYHAQDILSCYVPVDQYNDDLQEQYDKGHADGHKEGWQECLEFIDYNFDIDLFDGVKLSEKTQEKIINNFRKVLENAEEKIR